MTFHGPARALRFAGRFATSVPWVAREFTRLGRPGCVVAYGKSPGDDLLCTTVCRELRARGVRRIWMLSNHPALFELNNDVARVLPHDDRYFLLARPLLARIVKPAYTGVAAGSDVQLPPTRHILSIMCAQAGIRGDVRIRPYMRLSEEEISRGKLSNKRQIAIQSSGLAAAMPMANKEWFPDRFQTVVTALRERYAFVQLGSATDPALDGAIDLRGRTSLREAAAIIARSDLFVGLVGLLMHVARSVDTRAVIVYGGRERAWQSGYTCNVNIESDIDCSPCWRIASCPHDRQCMRDIQVEAVVAAIRSQASLIGQPICDDADVI